MKRLIYILVFCGMLLIRTELFAADFEELDKPPEGVYQGQIFAGGFFSFGIPSGSMIDAENKFVQGSTYTFSDSEITKRLWITHLSYSYGVYGEYVFYDHIGAYAQFGGMSVVQRTDFGRDYSNKRRFLYSGILFLLGPNFHLTDRKPWDVSLSPLVGFAYGTVKATPVADSLLVGQDPGNSSVKIPYNPTNSRKKMFAIVYGVNLKGTIYFSGGFSLSLGGEWIRIPVKLPGAIPEQNPQTAAIYMNGKSSGNIDNLRLIVSAGYAFKH